MAKKTTDTTDNMALWNSVEEVPVEFLKEIKGGRLKGKTDISPMWRLWQLTEKFGPCGTGWYYKLTDWKVLEGGGESSIQAVIELYVGDSMPIIGVGGSKIVQKETSGLYHNDEALKMAVTDAISVACKQLGFASAIYEGRFDGSKYSERKEHNVQTPEDGQKPASTSRSTPPQARPQANKGSSSTAKPEPSPLNASIAKVLEAFTAIDTPVEQLEEVIGKKEGDWGEADIEKLRKYYSTAAKAYHEFNKK